MKLVVDSNRIMAALIKDSASREILLSDKFEFLAPEKVMEEIEKYREEILNKAGLEEEDFKLLLSLILNEIEIISFEEIEKYNRITKTLSMTLVIFLF